MVEIRFLDISKIHQDEYERLYHLCSEERKNKVNRYIDIDDRKRGVAAHVLMKYGWIESGRKIANLKILYNAYGKPYLQNDESFCFNLSHAGKWVAIAYGNFEVGIDIEQIQEKRYGIVEQFYGDKEKVYIQKADSVKEGNRRFTQIWTIKESYLKYLGIGLNKELNSFDFEIKEQIRLYNKRGEKQSQLSFFSKLFRDEYYLSICGIEKEIQIKEIYVEDLLENESISLL